MDHQMNLRVSEEFGQYFARIPLTSSANIVHGNALRLDWNEVIPAENLDYILGNPPFVGAKFMDTEQKADVAVVCEGIRSYGLLDFCCFMVRQSGENDAGNINSLRICFNKLNQPR